jgi:hypothetical protein
VGVADEGRPPQGGAEPLVQARDERAVSREVEERDVSREVEERDVAGRFRAVELVLAQAGRRGPRR